MVAAPDPPAACGRSVLMRAGEPPVPVTLPLLCALGRHKTDGLARWNAGYYFARCTRCRRDLVRTAFTRWQIPRGFRVVWQGDGVHARTTDDRGDVAAGARVEFPLRDDVRSVATDMPVLAGLSRNADEPGDVSANGLLAQPEETRATDAPLQDASGVEALASAEIQATEIHADADEPLVVKAPLDGDEEDAAIVGEVSQGPTGTPSWFDRDHSFEEDVRFDANDRLVDYRSAETLDPSGDAPAPEIVSEPEPSTGPESQAATEAKPEPEPEIEAEPAQESTPQPSPPPVASKYPVVPDFMDEGPAGVGWEAVTGRIVPLSGADPVVPEVEADAPRDVPSGVLSQGWQGLVRKRAQGAGDQGLDWLRGMRARKAVAPTASRTPTASPTPTASQTPTASPTIVSQPVTEAPGSAETGADVGEEPPVAGSDAPSLQDTAAPAEAMASAAMVRSPVSVPRFGGLPMHHSPLVAAVVFGALVVAAAVVDGRNSPPRVVYISEPAASTSSTAMSPTAPRPRASGWTPVPSDVAYVTAGLLKCRATPSNDAETLRTLSRGATVRVLGTSPGWFSVAHRDQQCWVAGQHISKTKPA